MWQKFQNSLTETERLRSEQEEIKRRAAAEQKAAVNRMADEFEGKIGRLIGMLSSVPISSLRSVAANAAAPRGECHLTPARIGARTTLSNAAAKI